MRCGRAHSRARLCHRVPFADAGPAPPVTHMERGLFPWSSSKRSPAGPSASTAAACRRCFSSADHADQHTASDTSLPSSASVEVSPCLATQSSANGKLSRFRRRAPKAWSARTASSGEICTPQWTLQKNVRSEESNRAERRLATVSRRSSSATEMNQTRDSCAAVSTPCGAQLHPPHAPARHARTRGRP